MLKPETAAGVTTIAAFETVEADGYRVTAIPAVHSTKDPLNYVVQSKDRTLLYAADTGPYADETLKFLGRYRFDCVISECTGGLGRIDYGTHLALSDVVRFKERMSEVKASDAKTKWFLTHFSHSGAGSYAELAKAARRSGMTVACDGLKVRI